MECYYCELKIKRGNMKHNPNRYHGEGDGVVIFHKKCFDEWYDEEHRYDGYDAEDI